MERALYLVTTTLPTRPEAERMARTLVEENLAACAQVGSPIRSWYIWKGAVEGDPETPLALKVRADRLDDCFDRMRGMHPYDTPQLVATPVDRVDPGYLAWCYGEGDA